ncbi:MAG: ice-binding family protein [Candidatus Gracilibacteria bacterium]
MKKIAKFLFAVMIAVSLMFGFIGPVTVFAATTPVLGAAKTYGILGSTFTNTSAGTTINGDVGFTTGPAVTPSGTHSNYGSGAPYAVAGADQSIALSALNGESCDFNLSGATDLSLLPQPLTPGVYCITGAASIGTSGITLTGSGTYIFRISGALTTAANASVLLNGGASACDVFWTPTAATTFAANSVFEGTIIGDAGITVGASTVWTGRALAFGGTITTDTDTITVPTCSAVPATLNVIKQVVNDNGGTATASSFNLRVTALGVDVLGSPAAGVSSPGTTYSLSADTYVVSENTNASYSQSFSGDCDSSGSITLFDGYDKTCTITNNDIGGGSAIIPPAAATIRVVKNVINDDGGNRKITDFPLFVNGMSVISGVINVFPVPITYTITESADSHYVQSFSGDCNVDGRLNLAWGDNKTCTITNDDIGVVAAVVQNPVATAIPVIEIAPDVATAPVITAVAPAFPSTGFPPKEKSVSWEIALLVVALILIPTSLVLVLKKRKI